MHTDVHVAHISLKRPQPQLPSKALLVSWSGFIDTHRTLSPVRLSVGTYCHEHRVEDSMQVLLDYAAEGGHLYTLKWLLANTNEQCTQYAMVKVVCVHVSMRD
jgi:hypothetical protein